MMELSLYQSLLIVSGVVVLVFGMRVPKWTSFGIGFGLGLWGVHHLGFQISGPMTIATSIVGGVVVGGLFFIVQRLLSFAVGLVVGGYLYWALPWTDFFSSWLPTTLTSYAVPLTAIVIIAAVIVLSRWSLIIERVMISASGALLVCGGLGRMEQPEWVVGIATVSLAIDGLLRE